jgi:hypothetical protein
MKSLKKILATAMFAIVFTVGAFAQNSRSNLIVL